MSSPIRVCVIAVVTIVLIIQSLLVLKLSQTAGLAPETRTAIVETKASKTVAKSCPKCPECPQETVSEAPKSSENVLKDSIHGVIAEMRKVWDHKATQGIGIRLTETEPPFHMGILNTGGDEAVSTIIARLGLSPPLFAVDTVRDVCKANKGGKVLDIGANVGFFGLFSAAAGCNAQLFEMQKPLVDLINFSIKMNGWEDRANVRWGAVSSESDTRLWVYRGDGANPGSFSPTTEPGESNAEIHTVAIDDIVGEDDVFEIVKIDVEGHEYKTLVGMTKLLESKRVKRMILEFWADTGAEWLRKFDKWGYDINLILGDDSHEVKPIKPAEFDDFVAKIRTNPFGPREDLFIELKK